VKIFGRYGNWINYFPTTSKSTSKTGLLIVCVRRLLIFWNHLVSASDISRQQHICQVWRSKSDSNRAIRVEGEHKKYRTATFVDISTVNANSCMKPYTTVK